MDKKMMNELVKAVNVIASEKGIDKSVIASAMEAAMAAAYKKKEGINIETGEIKMYICKTVVEDEDFDDEDDLITLKDAKEYKEDAVIGDVIDIQVPLTLDFGRVAAGTAKQVVVQKIKEAEKNLINEEFKDKQDELLVGILSREDSRNYYVDLGKTSGVLPKDEIIPGEKLVMGSSIKVVVLRLMFLNWKLVLRDSLYCYREGIMVLLRDFLKQRFLNLLMVQLFFILLLGMLVVEVR